MAEEIVIASGNAGKLAEIREILAPLSITVVPQTEFQVDNAVEDGLTFIENALIKARHAARICARPVIADDSGLEVAALNGAPGIHSARYAGVHGDDSANNEKLLRELKGLEGRKRRANFRCVMVYLRHAEDPAPLIAQGVWRGRIINEARGTGGFGYDPLFLGDGLGSTGAELASVQKNAISHRGQALRLLAAELAALHRR
ncbi:MAG: RdgB/HAM1 family non-canonical purine NTP pyrophosphatase [Pseudomonadota bacterium]